ncbi:MAG: ribosome hibernation-promoting factor, HPF/YfiA family [Desulfovibrio sp.]|jgi:ribosomal subunit interface protein|nr:ribosome-associated translation inhibitor RaiA [Mailhella sp.]
MQIEVVFRNVTPADTLKNYALKRFQKISRIVGNDEEADLLITLSRESSQFRADAQLSGTGLNFSASEKNDDMYAAIDLCNDRLGQQLRKAAEKRSQIDRSSISDSLAE